MRFLAVILFLLFSFLGYSQPYPRTKGEHSFLKDAQGRIITTQSGGLLAVLQADTATTYLGQPPDTVQSFSVNEGGEPFISLLNEIISYWTLEEATGDAIDSVGTADLPIYGTVTREQTGKIGDCYYFTTDGYLGNIDTYYEFNGAFSVSLWMKTTSGAQNQGLICNFGTSNRGWDLYMNSGAENSAVPFFNIRNNIETTSVYGGPAINNNAWHHLVCTFGDDDTLKLYTDGNLIEKDYSLNGVLYDASCRLRIGSRYTGMHYTGLIDEPAVWNKELTQTEIDSLFAEAQYPFPAQGSGGDSLRMRNTDFDERADTFRVNYKVGAWPSTRISDSVVFAFGLKDTADYNDTTFRYWGKKDTTANFELWSGLIPEDTWTVVPNKDTVFVDSSGKDPPPQDYPGIWDTIFYYDFEDNSAPIHYDLTAFLADGWTGITQNGHPNYRASDWRGPGDWYGKVPDSIVVDPQTLSKVLKLNFDDDIYSGYGGNYGRGGDSWRMPLSPVYTEVYLSYNMMLRPGWDWAGGGKLSPGLCGGTDSWSSEPQEYGEGFRMSAIIWDHGYSSPDEEGNIGFYLYYQDQTHTNGQFFPFEDFQPEGEGLTGNYNDGGKFIYPVTDSVWYNITIRCVTNTHTGSTPNKDGILEGFINGHLVERVSGLYLITYPDIGNEINQFFMHQTFGSYYPQNDEWSFFDDICMFTYDEEVDVPRGNELSPPGRVLNLPNWPKTQEEE